MAGVKSVQTRRYRYGSNSQGWDSWGNGVSLSGTIKQYTNETSEATGAKMCMKLELEKAYVNVVSTLSIGMYGGYQGNTLPSGYTPYLRWRLYTSDPTQYSSTIPSGAIASGDVALTKGGYSLVTMSASGFSTTADYLYLLITPVPFTTNPEVYKNEIKWEQGYARDLYTKDSFTLTYTEKPIELTHTPDTVTTGGRISVTIGNRASRTLTLVFKYGNTTLATASATSDTVAVQCTKTWFDTAGVTALTSMTVTISVEGKSGTDSFTLQAGSDMNPTVGTPTVTIVQPSPASTNYPSTYLKNISKAKVAATITKNTNANISSVTCVYTGGSFLLTYNSSTGKYEGTTPGPLASSGTFTITATDARGLSGSATSSSISVVAYVTPTVSVDDVYTYRCNSSGTKTDGGSYYRIKATATIYTGLTGNVATVFTVKETNTATATSLTSGTQSSAIQTNVSADSVMTLLVTLTDRVGYSVTKQVRLDGSAKWIRVETAGTGVSVGLGKKPEKVQNGVSVVDLDVNEGKTPSVLGFLLEGMNALAFEGYISKDKLGTSFGKDFHNVDRSSPISIQNGAEMFYKAANNSGWANYPSPTSSIGWVGLRKVFIYNEDECLVMVIELDPKPGRLWFCYHKTSWSGWYKIEPTAV